MEPRVPIAWTNGSAGKGTKSVLVPCDACGPTGKMGITYLSPLEVLANET
jgi:hypothetical protein